MPDIDIDFCIRGRGAVIDHVTQVYGRDSVCQIITFGTMASKAAIKDVGRALNMPLGDVERIAKLIRLPFGAETQAFRRLSNKFRNSKQLSTPIRKFATWSILRCVWKAVRATHQSMPQALFISLSLFTR